MVRYHHTVHPNALPDLVTVLSSLPPENGPYSINHDMTLTETEFGWDKYHTTIFFDQPINTGFSYSNVRSKGDHLG